LLIEQERELVWRQTKIERLTHELALHKRHRFGVKAERLSTRVRQLHSQAIVFARVHFQKCHYNSANCSGAAGFSIPKA
ncbi:MAG: hypothetical protein JSS47_00775, partial [Proteobacteria bacterium]|nr:hypothetical protein [Pseudomonadota bacterium]